MPRFDDDFLTIYRVFSVLNLLPLKFVNLNAWLIDNKMKSIKVLFVCLGNICRSPLAEAVFKHKIAERNIAKFFEADSCGTSNYHIGDNPDPRTIANAKKNGVLMNHKGRQLSEDDLSYYDYILAMDESNHANIMRLRNASENAEKIMLMRAFDPAGTGKEVPDPYYGTEMNFQEVFDILDRTVDHFINHLEKEKLSSLNA
jgi:protein-tyrosine phosphatase